MLVATRTLANAVLGGKYTSMIGKPHDAETSLTVIPVISLEKWLWRHAANGRPGENMTK